MVEENQDYQIMDETVLLDSSISEPKNGYQNQKDFTTLIAWQNAREVKLFFYKKVIPLLPASEKYALSSQIQRAAVSITANISEGYGRFHYKESVQFYRIARGSLYELKDHLITSLDLEYVDKNIAVEGFTLIEKTKISLNGFINLIRSKYEKR
ncbi:MAG: four helix bundle protein [Candidatus Marinimicrobia bacterium]|nr:four helix bundle protein [FCB group bacterium]MBL7023837.1 four helix bundle protein [Candidatus Neomarinimicrobiota bacterium]